MNRLFSTLLACAMLATAAFAQEREWTLDQSEDEAFLIFGVPESDDVGISLWCNIRSGEVRFFVPAAPDALKGKAKANVSIFVNGKEFSFNAAAVPNEESESISIEANTGVNDPLFAELKNADRFSLKVDGIEQNFPMMGADLEGLLSVCAKSS